MTTLLLFLTVALVMGFIFYGADVAASISVSHQRPKVWRKATAQHMLEERAKLCRLGADARKMIQAWQDDVGALHIGWAVELEVVDRLYSANRQFREEQFDKLYPEFKDFNPWRESRDE